MNLRFSNYTHELQLSNQFNLLFISLDWSRPKDLRTPLSTASIEAYFRKNKTENINFEFINFNLNDPDFSICEVQKSINKVRPNILALGAYIWNEQYVPDVVKWTKEHYPETKIILGGPQITYGNHHLSMEYPGADYFIRGEGELPFTELVNVLSHHDVPTQDLMTHYAIFTPDTLIPGKCDNIFTAELNKLTSPYLDQILPIEHNQEFVRWETLRRCPYRCSFCQFRLEGHSVSEINHERLFQELEYFKEKKVQEINVLDPIFNLRPKHYLEICRKIDTLEMQTRFYFQCRLELLCRKDGEEFLHFCKDHDIWLEFGIQTFRQEESDAIERGNNYEKIDKAIQTLNQFNVPFDLHLIFGLPFQSFEDFLWSYEKAKKACPNGLYLFPLNVLKGTNLYQNRLEWKYKFDTRNNNILIENNWMAKDEVDYLNKASSKINAESKAFRGSGKLIQPPDLHQLI